jgi:hypothetical protein
VSEITGIAGRRAARLQPWGIRTCPDLAQADRRLVRKLLTAAREALWWELNGNPVQPIRPQRPLHKVLSRGGSFGDPVVAPPVLYAWLVRNLERLIEELEFHAVGASELTVWVAYRNGQVGLGQTTLTVPSDRFDVLLDAARPCLRVMWRGRLHEVRADVVGLSALVRRPTTMSKTSTIDPELFLHATAPAGGLLGVSPVLPEPPPVTAERESPWGEHEPCEFAQMWALPHWLELLAINAVCAEPTLQSRKQ